MNFSLFRPFNDAFNEKYGWLRERYPYAFLLIEKQIRNFESGSIALCAQNARKSSRLNFGRMIRSTIFAYAYTGCSEPQFYLNFERFDWLESRLMTKMSEKGFLRFEKGKQLQRLATRGLAYPKFMKIAANHGMDFALESEALLERLDVDGKRNFELIKTVISKSNIKIFLMDGDTVPHAQIYCLAAQQLNIPYVVFAHGYIQNPRLVGIAPIKGDFLIPWTYQQFEDLSAYLQDHDARKLRYFGYPKEVFSGAGNADQVLIAWHTLLDRDRKAEADDLLSTIRRIRAEGYRISVRLHPKDANDRQLCELLAKENVEISRKSLRDDISQAELVIGSFSSVMVEAAMSGKNVLQLAAYSSLPFERVPLLYPHEAIRDVVGKLVSPPSMQSFDFEAFETFLHEILS